MSIYTPDRWVIVKLSGDTVGQPYYRVLGGWFGGYLGSDSWRMNSGITKITKTDYGYEIFGESGSSYQCHTATERLSNYTASIFGSLKQQAIDSGKDIKLEIVNIDTILDQFMEVENDPQA